MLHFRVPYTLEYYCSKPFRFSFNDKSNKITLIDSYATSSVTLDYDDIDSTTEFSFSKGNQSLNIYSLLLKTGEILHFVDNKAYINDLINSEQPSDLLSVLPEKNKYCSSFQKTLQNKRPCENAYIICASQSNYETRKQKLTEISKKHH